MISDSKNISIIADENIPFVEEFFSGFGDIKLLSAKEITPEIVSFADVLLVRSVTSVDSSLMAGSKVFFVGTATIGVDHVDQKYLQERSVFFTNAAGSNAESVAEYLIVSLLVVLNRKSISPFGKTIGIIGVGNIGSLVSEKAAALGMRVILNDPPQQRITGEAKYRPLSEVLKADIITCHVPLNKTGEDCTVHLIDEPELKLMSDNCILINTSRGPVVNNIALKKWLKDQPGRSAIFDVWENEPCPDTELVEAVDIATPHIAGYSFDGKVNGTKMLYDSFCDLVKTEKLARPEEFMPKPVPDMVTVNLDEYNSSEEAMLAIVTKIYDIESDDRRMREIIKLSAEEQGSYFTQLRKNYPIRREFAQISVKLICSVTCHWHSELIESLSILGFLRVSQEIASF